MIMLLSLRVESGWKTYGATRSRLRHSDLFKHLQVQRNIRKIYEIEAEIRLYVI
jgi:hypothetical protein